MLGAAVQAGRVLHALRPGTAFCWRPAVRGPTRAPAHKLADIAIIAPRARAMGRMSTGHRSRSGPGRSPPTPPDHLLSRSSRRVGYVVVPATAAGPTR